MTTFATKWLSSDKQAAFQVAPETSVRCFEPKNATPERTAASARRIFLRLFGDIVEQLNKAVDQRLLETGLSRARLIEKSGYDAAFISRVLTGDSGTNLRSIAAVLAITEYRLEVSAVSCENLNRRAAARRAQELEGRLVELEFSGGSNTWRVREHPRSFVERHHVFSENILCDFSNDDRRERL